jgi:hypothetical protein
MRRLITILIAAAMTMTLLILKANAQGNGHGHGRGKNKHEWKDSNRHSRHGSADTYSYDQRHRYSDDRAGHYYTGHHHVYYHPVFAHNHSRHCGHAVVVRYHERPRYIFYSDYGVYYDSRQEVYFSYTGRRWSVSASLPVHMRGASLHDAVCHEVEYYDDNFIAYLDKGRPMHSRVIRMN